MAHRQFFVVEAGVFVAEQQRDFVAVPQQRRDFAHRRAQVEFRQIHAALAPASSTTIEQGVDP